MKFTTVSCWVLLTLAYVAHADETLPPVDRQHMNELTQEDKEARRIIRNADRVRAPQEPFRYTLTLVEHKDGKDLLDQKQVMDISMRFYKPSEVHEKGDARSLVRFTYPVRDKGKSLLSDFDKMWYYAPDLRRPIPISRQQRLMGQISNGDVVAADFDYSYISTLVGEEACGDKQCYKLELKRRWPYVTYPAITYWVQKDTYHPDHAEFKSADGLVMKRSYYKDYREVLGVVRPHQILVEDALRKDNYTMMNYSDMALESLPESYFQKEYLMRLN